MQKKDLHPVVATAHCAFQQQEEGPAAAIAEVVNMMSPSLAVVMASLALLAILGAVSEAFQPPPVAPPNVATTTTATAVLRASCLLGRRRPKELFAAAQGKDKEESSSSSSTPQRQQPRGGGGFFRAVGSFFEELDAFMDDASARRLGNGAAFYGKRRSNFYGAQDKNKKRDKAVFDPTEDYQGPSTSGFFKWMPDEDGEMRPVTRMKNQVIEKKKPPTQPQLQQPKSAPSWFGRSNDD